MAETTTEAASSPSPRALRRARPIAVYLFVLALVALVPAFIFSAVLLQRNNEAQDRVVQALTLATTQAIGQSVDREIDGMISTLRALASTPAPERAELERLYQRAQAVLAGTGSTMIIIDEAFNQVVNTRFPFGTELPVVRDTANVTRVLETGEVLIGDVVFSPTSSRHIVPVLVPNHAADGEALVVVLAKDAADLAPVLLSHELPDGWQVALVDKLNQVIVASPGANAAVGERLFIPLNPSSRETRAWTWRRIGEEEFATITWTSPLTGWSLIAWAPQGVVARPLGEAVLSLAIGGVLLGALVSVAIYWVASQIGRSVQGLAADAKRLGSGVPVPARDYPILEIATVSAAVEDASHQRIAAEREVRFLLRELAHRSKNQMTVIAAMAKQTAKGADSVPEFVQKFEKRIFGLARSTDLLLANGIVGVDLEELLAGQIDPFCPLDSGRVSLEGPSVRLNNQAVQILGMAAHELATNAVKYGAFSRDSGKLGVTWARAGDRLSVVWREHVPELPERPERRGFGTVVLENMVGAALGAEVARTLHPDGIEWRFDIPLQVLEPGLPPETVGIGAEGTLVEQPLA